MSELTLPSVLLNREEITFAAYQQLLSLMHEEVHQTRKEKIVDRKIDKEKVEEVLPKEGFTRESARITRMLIREVDGISWELLDYGQSYALVGGFPDKQATEWLVNNHSHEELLNNK